ncbi:hypothetical protein AX774_g5396 [Zancudomyces culisetae]|uniref:Uncharacterized protein n=1 Tax=Zancudomyces culisetae TaxID=1213189 RepID=A0A1R1PJK1_ZANCU|nr:hypothetical protein AX774_g5396 [Zancudomyces culisetae]|eukprot:OMH81148.1 hypothetical protein AX774_g5396 [Zancudomyces culisetae]
MLQSDTLPIFITVTIFFVCVTVFTVLRQRKQKKIKLELQTQSNMAHIEALVESSALNSAQNAENALKASPPLPKYTPTLFTSPQQLEKFSIQGRPDNMRFMHGKSISENTCAENTVQP